ncbi:MAG: TolC family protein [Clostridium sp.]|nr:TolC family protein [Clostridium sp.]
MNNHGLLTGALAALLACLCPSVAEAQTRRVMTLEEIFEIAEQNSAQLRPSFSAAEEARREVSVVRAERLPEINASLSLSYIGDGFTVKRNFSDYQRAPIPHFGNTLAVGVTQPVYTGGAISAGIELAESKLTASRYATELSRDNIRFQLTGFYLDIYKYSNLRTVVENNLAQARQVLEEMRARHEQGVVLQNDITRYELLVSNLELQFIRIDNTIRILSDNLTTIAGLEPGTVVIPDPSILDRSLPSEPESQWQADAVAGSPSMSLARTNLEISRSAEKLARSGRLPKIGLQAGWNFDGPILVEVPPINRNLSYWYVGVGINYSISSLFKTNKSIARSRAATRHAVDELDAARESTELTVRAEYVRYLESYEELKTRQKSVELADRNYSTVSTRYSADMALITDMLDAANSKLDAEQQLVNARINIIYYYYKLLFISGKI